MTKVKHSLATSWLKCKLDSIALVQRRSPFQKDCPLIYVHTQSPTILKQLSAKEKSSRSSKVDLLYLCALWSSISQSVYKCRDDV